MASLERELSMRNKKVYPEEEEFIDKLRAAGDKLSRCPNDKKEANAAIAHIEEKQSMAAIPLKVEVKSSCRNYSQVVNSMAKILQKFDTASNFPSAPNSGKNIVYGAAKIIVLHANGEAK
jgi:hypothetical protein